MIIELRDKTPLPPTVGITGTTFGIRVAQVHSRHRKDAAILMLKQGQWERDELLRIECHIHLTPDEDIKLSAIIADSAGRLRSSLRSINDELHQMNLRIVRKLPRQQQITFERLMKREVK